MFDALKAISGGVLALKGQLVKGSSYLLAGKAKVFDKAGDVITSFGKHLAASANSKPYPPPAYYPPIHPIGKIQSSVKFVEFFGAVIMIAMTGFESYLYNYIL